MLTINLHISQIEHVYSNNARRIQYLNGTRKEVSPNGRASIIYFFNQDRKELREDGSSIYFYAQSNIYHTALPDGSAFIEFPKYHFTLSF